MRQVLAGIRLSGKTRGTGEKSPAKGEVEFKPRGGQLILVKAEEAVAKVLEHLLLGA
jgi:hypothetical protein